jgi:hypothetical protein
MVVGRIPDLRDTIYGQALAAIARFLPSSGRNGDLLLLLER